MAWLLHLIHNETEMKSGTKRRKPPFRKDKRRRHRHGRVTVTYSDGEKFVRVYTDRVKAANDAERQKKSPVVKGASITQVGAQNRERTYGSTSSTVDLDQLWERLAKMNDALRIAL